MGSGYWAVIKKGVGAFCNGCIVVLYDTCPLSRINMLFRGSLGSCLLFLARGTGSSQVVHTLFLCVQLDKSHTIYILTRFYRMFICYLLYTYLLTHLYLHNFCMLLIRGLCDLCDSIVD